MRRPVLLTVLVFVVLPILGACLADNTESGDGATVPVVPDAEMESPDPEDGSVGSPDGVTPESTQSDARDGGGSEVGRTGTGSSSAGGFTGSGESTPREDVLSALYDLSDPGHPEPLVDLSEIRFVVSPDVIPALEDPAFEPVGEVDWLPLNEPVLMLKVDDDVRAYPLRIMTWHEIVNHTVGGVPVAVSYCPLCNSGVVYDRRLGERVLDFGTSGALLNSSLVMYDRQTESLWSHYTGQAVAGHLTGSRLVLLPSQIVSFEVFSSAYPRGLVLSFDTGHLRQYGRNPYISYDDPDGEPGFFFGALDDRLGAMTRVVAVRGDEEGVVISHDVLVEHGVVPFTFEGRELVALYELGTASALDTGVIAEGRDVGSSGVFVADVDGQGVELAPGGDGGFVDSATGLVFNILGIASDGSDGEVRLEPVEHLDTFWFAVSAFYPDARIIELPE
ncbi:MAG: DUF3179 domain-containing protein [Acidimicrobiaceae bacterium]|nr:DUF3179 domain-containing protein [Acidimicrobiaceae bacterium]